MTETAESRPEQEAVTQEPQAQQDDRRTRRRTFLIDRKFQMKWTLIIVSVGVVISLILGYFIVRLSLANTELVDMDESIMTEVSKFDARAIIYLVGFVLVMAVALFTWGIFMTHRVAGPIFIISRYLRQIAEGEVPRLRPLRKHDELVAFFETVSSMIERLRKDHAEEAEILEQAMARLEKEGAAAESLKVLGELAARKRNWGSDQTK
ncbi:MAG: hypothetical protein JXR96_00440 [Deltaproteobacteria bacterium]|nr:hypothetical protein [Deltaproteobacteria bacterium]